jgi:hypothetical protein
VKEKNLKLNQKMSHRIYKRRFLSEAHKRKIGLANSIALRDKKLPEKVKRKISRRLAGRKLTKEHRKHLSEVLKGKPKSEEHKRKLSEAWKGRPRPWNTGEKCHFWRGGMMEKIPVKCTVCGKINLVRRGWVMKRVSPYKCRNCCNKGKKRTLEYRLKSSLAHRKYSLDESFFEKINTEEKAYWLGFLSGDGAITENKVRLRLAIKDKLHLKKFKEAMKWAGKDYYHKDTDALEVYFRSLRMVTDLARCHVTSRKTFTVRFPDISESLERHFVRGVFDADGCINRAKRITRGKSSQIYIFYGGEFCIEGNKEFISAIQSRLVKLGLPITSINYSGKSINRVRYGGINQLRKIHNYLYENATIFLERKKKLYEDILKNYHYEIIRSQQKEFKIRKFELAS